MDAQEVKANAEAIVAEYQKALSTLHFSNWLSGRTQTVNGVAQAYLEAIAVLERIANESWVESEMFNKIAQDFLARRVKE